MTNNTQGDIRRFNPWTLKRDRVGFFVVHDNGCEVPDVRNDWTTHIGEKKWAGSRDVEMLRQASEYANKQQGERDGTLDPNLHRRRI